jgi:hypothetical protein
MQNEPPGHILPSQAADRTLYAELTMPCSHVASNQLGAVLSIPQLELVLGSELDTMAWSDTEFRNAVFDLVLRIKTTANYCTREIHLRHAATIKLGFLK